MFEVLNWHKIFRKFQTYAVTAKAASAWPALKLSFNVITTCNTTCLEPYEVREVAKGFYFPGLKSN